MNYKGNDKYGTLPRRTMIANQPHMLAYINPQEEMLLRRLGGTGQAGPMGVPAYPPGDGGFSPDGGGGYGGGGGFGGFGGSEGGGGGGYNSGYVDPGLAVAAAQAAAQQQAAANAEAMAAADAAIAGQMAAAAQEEANAAAMAEAEAAITFDIPTVPTPNISVPEPDYGMGSIAGVPDVAVSDNIDYSPTGPESPGVPDVGYDFGMGSIDGVSTSAGDTGDTTGYAIDIADTNIYTLNDDGTYTITDGEPDPEPDFDPNEYIGGPGDGGGDGTTTTTADTVPDFVKVEYNFNTSLEASPYGGMWSNITSTIPKYEFDAYEDADGLLRFSENDELVPEEILKYMPYAKKTLIVEEEETEEETEE